MEQVLESALKTLSLREKEEKTPEKEVITENAEESPPKEKEKEKSFLTVSFSAIKNVNTSRTYINPYKVSAILAIFSIPGSKGICISWYPRVLCISFALEGLINIEWSILLARIFSMAGLYIEGTKREYYANTSLIPLLLIMLAHLTYVAERAAGKSAFLDLLTVFFISCFLMVYDIFIAEKYSGTRKCIEIISNRVFLLHIISGGVIWLVYHALHSCLILLDKGKKQISAAGIICIIFIGIIFYLISHKLSNAIDILSIEMEQEKENLYKGKNNWRLAVDVDWAKKAQESFGVAADGNSSGVLEQGKGSKQRNKRSLRVHACSRNVTSTVRASNRVSACREDGVNEIFAQRVQNAHRGRKEINSAAERRK